MDAPAIRIGWLRMLNRLFRRHGRAVYGELIDLTERLIADAERERAATRRGRR